MADFVVDTGEAIITNRIKGSGTEPVFIGWGTGAGTTTKTDTTLFTEAASTATSGPDNIRVTGTSSRVTTNSTNDTYQVVGTLTAAGSITITNVGLFDGDGNQTSPAAPSGDTLYAKSDFTGIPLNAADSIQFTLRTVLSQFLRYS